MMIFMMGMADSLDVSVESMVVISGVFYNSFGSISFIQSVFTLDFVTVSFLPLAFVVMSVWVFYSIFEFVFWISEIILVLFMVDWFMVVNSWSDMVDYWSVFMMTVVAVFNVTFSESSCSHSEKGKGKYKLKF
jgi:hypothetical protein